MAEHLAARAGWPDDPAVLVRRFWSEAVGAGLGLDDDLMQPWTEVVEEVAGHLADIVPGSFSCQPPITIPPGPPEIVGGAIAERFHGRGDLEFFLLLVDLLHSVWREGTVAGGPAAAEVDGFFARLHRALAGRWLDLETAVLRRRLREAKLSSLRERRRYHTVFNRMREPALVVDGELAIIDANQAFCDFFRVERAELLGVPACAVLGAAVCDSHDLTTAIGSRRSFTDLEVELEIGGRQRLLVICGTFLGEINGLPGGGILIFQDVTEKRAYERRLQCREEQYRTLVENVPDVIWRSTVDGRIVYISPNVERLTGFSVEEIVRGGRSFWLSRIYESDNAEVGRLFEELFLQGQPIDCCYRFRRRDERWIWIQERSGRVYEDKGMRLADGVLSDITRLKLAEEELERHHLRLAELVDEQTRELRRMNEQLRAEVAVRSEREEELERLTQRLRTANEELEQFAHVVSHDLREPLVLIEAFAHKLTSGYGDRLDERGRRYLKGIDKAVGRMHALVESVLQLARLDSGKTVAKPVELAHILQDVVEHLEPRLAASGGRVETRCLHTLCGDPVQIWQLFLNLVANALKYRRQDVPPHVRVWSRTVDDDFCEIVVEDNGIGIREEDRQRIFLPFTRLHTERSGCGIGLATCKKIVCRHGGCIEARPAAAGGAVFVIRLPLWRVGGG